MDWFTQVVKFSDGTEMVLFTQGFKAASADIVWLSVHGADPIDVSQPEPELRVNLIMW